MKFASAAVTLIASGLPAFPRANAEQCVHGGFLIEFDGACTPEAVLEAYEDQVFEAAGATSAGCSGDARDDLLAKLAEGGIEDLEDLCAKVYEDQERIPFRDAANRGDEDMLFEKMFFNGKTDWQEEVETIYETEDRTATSILKEDAEQVRAFYRGIAQGRRVEWPGSLENFKSSVTDAHGLETCTTNAAMCCWPKDRQANDNNGNCADPYDEDCVDKDPADNTDLCYVDAERGNQSTGFDVGGAAFVYTPGDNNQGEGAIHCHGLAWSNDADHHTARYKANNMFFVSMYDHMYQRGYVKNVPGAPMCGCVEQMPTVSRSDCTQVDLTETIEISYNSVTKTFKTNLAAVHVDFNSCQGINHRNNDLWAYIARLYYEGHVTPRQFGEAGRIITDNGCQEATKFHLNNIGYMPGYDHEVAVWTNVAGRESMKLHDGYGHRAFHLSLRPGDQPDATNAHYGIIYRACQSCVRTHKKIFYRRRTPVPEDFDLLHNILYEENDGDGNNVWDEDFSLHSTFHDAENDLNPWECPDDEFDYDETFYGECSPDGTKVRNQRSKFDDWNDRNDVAYYANKAEDDGLELLPSTAIMGRDRAGGVALKDGDGVVYMTGSGRDIWNWWDDFNYLSQPAAGDHTVIVHAGSISSPDPHDYSKSGIMFRSSLEPRSAHYSLLLTGSNGVCPQARFEDRTYPSGWDCVNSGAEEAWLKVEKRMDVLTSFVGYQLGDAPIQWEMVDSRSVPALGDSYLVGLAVCSAREEAQEVVFRGYDVEAYHWPSASPSLSSAPTPVSTPGELFYAGNNGAPAEAFPLKECEGDCDSNGDCEGDLMCYQRGGTEAVPGCNGVGSRSSDYCAKRATDDTLFLVRRSSSMGNCDGNCASDDDCRGTMVCNSPDADGKVPGCIGLAVDLKYCHRPALVTLAEVAAPLGLCEGACSTDADCEGSLSCFLRTDTEPVLGCAGEGAPGAGYCVERPLFHLWNKAEGGSPVEAFPLGHCEGDCGTDFDCEGHLICEHRSGDEEVPGCEGTGRSGSGYCRYPSLLYSGSNGVPYDNFPLGICEGDCDSDEECADGLHCFQRNGKSEVVGCAGAGSSSVDYCAPRATETTLFNFGDGGVVLGMCEGDCDNDGECEGDLVCFQRSGYEEVYGCEGLGSKASDYCHPVPPPAPGSCIPDPETCGCDSEGQSDYRGTVAVTASGKTCQAWSSQTPHAHSNTPENRPSSGLDSNYCRNPDGEPSTWCYTTDPNTRWELCDVPSCPLLP